MRCNCVECENNDGIGFCEIDCYVNLDENGVCTDMYIRMEKEVKPDEREEHAGG